MLIHTPDIIVVAIVRFRIGDLNGVFLITFNSFVEFGLLKSDSKLRFACKSGIGNFRFIAVKVVLKHKQKKKKITN